MNYVLYHAGCSDGFAAAAVAWLRFGDADTAYIPCQYGQPLPAVLDTHLPPDAAESVSVWILDFSFPQDVLTRLHQRVKSLVVLDHHATAAEDLFGLHSATFDQNECGATMAWRHFYTDVPIPEFLCYIRDRDLWRWQLPDSRAVSAVVRQLPKKFETWARLLINDRIDDSLISDGKAILTAECAIVDSLTRVPLPLVQLNQPGGGVWRFPAVNSPILQSEIGEALYSGNAGYHERGACIYWYSPKANQWIYSLRSAELDVSGVAKLYGGGGHRAAAGFTRPLPPLSADVCAALTFPFDHPILLIPQ